MVALCKLLQLHPRRWLMQKQHAFLKTGQLVRLQNLPRQAFGKIVFSQAALDELAQCILRQTRGRRINRGQRFRQRHVAAHDAVFGMHHLCAEKTLADFAQQPHFCAGRECLDLAAVKIEKSHHQRAAGIFNLAHQRAPRPVLDLSIHHHSFYLDGLAGWRIFDRIYMRFVFVSDWQMQHQVQRARYA